MIELAGMLAASGSRGDWTSFVPGPTDASLAVVGLVAAYCARAAARAAGIGRRRSLEIQRSRAGIDRRRRSRRRADRVRQIGWTGLVVVTLLLAVSHCFRLEWKLVDAIRHAVSAWGWWGDRRPVQAAALMTGAAMMLAVLGVGLVLTRRASHRTSAPPVLLAAIVLAVAARSVSYHEVDALLVRRSFGAPVWWWVELLLLVAVAIAGARSAAWRRRLPFTPASGVDSAASDPRERSAPGGPSTAP